MGKGSKPLGPWSPGRWCSGANKLTVGSCEAHIQVQEDPVLVQPCPAGHSESYGQSQEWNREAGVSGAICCSQCIFIHGGGGGLRLPDPCGAYVDLSCPGTAVCEDMEPPVTAPQSHLTVCFRCPCGKSRPEAGSQPSARMYLNLDLGHSF